jgi:hypothetical protein
MSIQAAKARRGDKRKEGGKKMKEKFKSSSFRLKRQEKKRCKGGDRCLFIHVCLTAFFRRKVGQTQR